ncbi:alpha/beta hydrolase [Iamia sp. SCSIO 61187]|uniref:poly(ethylene terephthalate) hydrolase family protein n=1 Tax=Iamia sp. SCSIO 61187 TaxID=2722752 RepID=UPI001C62BC47|nr:hypothetical protein [Iamia sp. SCSIO 61187]QYG93882.1 alpha/beta hydrolase [Iamia sp. SCSIO 61187]
MTSISRPLRRVLLGSLLALALAMTAIAAPGGAASTIETTYKATGTWTVSTVAGTDAQGRPITIVHPTNLGANGFDHPIITWGNGTGSTPSNYTATLQHLASWGFVVVASNSGSVGYGGEVWAAAQAMIALNSNPSSPFDGKLDTTKIGAAGHSQGATGAVNATIMSNGAITSTAPIAFVDPFWFFGNTAQMPDWTKVTKPIFFISATGDWLASRSQQTTYYNGIAGPAAKAATKGGDHNVIQQPANAQLGYLTAWFMYTLRGDTTARQAFAGTAPELLGNTGWTNAARKNLP